MYTGDTYTSRVVQNIGCDREKSSSIVNWRRCVDVQRRSGVYGRELNRVLPDFDFDLDAVRLRGGCHLRLAELATIMYDILDDGCLTPMKIPRDSYRNTPRHGTN
jgi:hypothetical protein